MTLEEDPAWVPAAVHWRGSGPVVEWRRVGERRFTDPFFCDTIQAANDAARHETTLEQLDAIAAASDPLPPVGFIFHLSRCGSTLLTQMLAQLPQHIVLSEPGPVNDILWPEAPLAEESRRITWLRGMLAVLGRRRYPGEARVFVKFDAWHTLDWPLIRAAYPDVPWIFVYRDPVEVLVSHAGSPGSQMIPGILDAERLGVVRPPWTEAGLRTYAGQVLARIAGAALENTDAAGRLVHYQELPAALSGILRHFNTTVTPGELTQMLAAAAHHSKHPARAYSPDSALRQAQATPEMRSLAEEYAGALYAELEARRRAQPPL